MLILLLAQTALAQTAPTQPAMNAQNYTPPIDSEMLMWTNDASSKPDGYFGARLWANYAKDPLVYQFSDGTTADEVLVGDLLQLDAIASISYSRLRLGVDVPLYMMATGTQVNTGTGLGDMALDLKGSVLDTDHDAFGLAFGGRITLPTATVDAPLGAPALSGALQAMVDKRVGDLLFAANLGTTFGPEIALENVTINDQFFWRGGLGYALTRNAGLSLDIAGQSAYSAPLSNAASSPIEGMLGGWGRLGNVVLRGGLGTGLTAGIGAPDFRSVFSVAYERPTDLDTDMDGIYDVDDQCIDQPEDKDGWKDDDGCPDPTTKVMVRFVDEDGYAVEGVGSTISGDGIDPIVKDGAYEIALNSGRYHLVAQAAGFEDLVMDTNIPQIAQQELVVTMKAFPATLVIKTNTPDGRAIASRWSIGDEFHNSPRGLSESQVKAGQYVLHVQAKDYKIIRQPLALAPGERKELQFTLEPSKIVVTKKQIELSEEVYFDTGKATIKPESFSMLGEVAVVLLDNPDIALLSIEGHTDSRGSARANQVLSEARAASVRQFLIDKGVDASRLKSTGYGESRPLVKGNNAAAWAKNRRVDLRIEKRTGK
ncbi:MAG: OmpA family protein [Oligoflexia bacterium]|nr:OmpA family protein [Oligoflexia bacterium]